MAEADFDVLLCVRTELSISRLLSQKPVRLAFCTFDGSSFALRRLLLCICSEMKIFSEVPHS